MPHLGWTPEQEEEHRRLCALPFRMPIEDVFHLKGRGVCLTGRVAAGRLKEGDEIVIVGDGEPLHTQAVRFEIFGRIYEIEVGDNIGILLPKDIKEQVEKGMIITKRE